MGAALADRLFHEGDRQFELNYGGQKYMVFAENIGSDWLSVSLINTKIFYRPLMIIFASGRTDIPAFYSEWFMNRVREGFVEVPLSLLGGSDYFALRVYGESMIGAGIQDGDLIVIRKAPHANVGQIVVAIDDEGQTTLKRLAHDGERYYLHPENPEFADIYPDELQIQGVAELMLRDLKH